MPPITRPSPPPLQVDITHVIGAGVLCWLAALVVVALVHPGRHGLWVWTCVAGAVLGALGFVVMRVQRRSARRR
ncbi:MAG: DUF2530 domain-containing protein [Mycobacteriales bacterium]|nr:MAG: DUF2530 domain-containing protein [Pseudonocardiales bacterium]